MFQRVRRLRARAFDERRRARDKEGRLNKSPCRAAKEKHIDKNDSKDSKMRQKRRSRSSHEEKEKKNI